MKKIVRVPLKVRLLWMEVLYQTTACAHRKIGSGNGYFMIWRNKKLFVFICFLTNFWSPWYWILIQEVTCKKMNAAQDVLFLVQKVHFQISLAICLQKYFFIILLMLVPLALSLSPLNTHIDGGSCITWQAWHWLFLLSTELNEIEKLHWL